MNREFKFPYQDGDLTASLQVESPYVNAIYKIDCKKSTPLIINYTHLNKNEETEVELNGEWLVDLSELKINDTTLITSKGMTYYGKQTTQLKELHGIWLRFLHTIDGVFIKANTSRFPEIIPLHIHSSNYNSIIQSEDNCCKAYVGSSRLKFMDCIKVHMEPDITKPEFVVVQNSEPVKVNLKITGVPGAATVRIYGIHAETITLPEEGNVSLSIAANQKGILPLCIAIFTKEMELVFYEIFDILSIKTQFITNDKRVNGCYVEYLRSMLMRRIGDSMPEEEPRGELLYPFSMWIRNFIGQSLSSFGFEEEAYTYLKLLDSIIIKDGYIKQSYDLDLSLRNDDWGTMGNDGMGFYIWQWGKLMTRYPDKKPSEAAIRKAISWFKFNTRWNGLISDGTEPVDLFTTAETTGSCYTQAIVISGLKVLSNAYKNQTKLSKSEQDLCGIIDTYVCRLSAALMFKYKNSDVFDEYTGAYDAVSIGNFEVFEPYMVEWIKMIWGMFDGDYLHAYSILQPGAFFNDPESVTEGFDSKIEQTIKRVQEERTCSYNKYLVYTHFPRIDAYGQFGMVLNLLHCNKVEDAWNFLDAYLKYYNISKLKYHLPECIDTHRMDQIDVPTQMAESMQSKVNEFPFLYPGDEMPSTDKGYWRTPANLIHVGYLFYIFDVMAGIYLKYQTLILRPRIPQALIPFKVTNYTVPFGAINIDTELIDGVIIATYEIIADGKAFIYDVRNGETLRVKTLLFISEHID